MKPLGVMDAKTLHRRREDYNVKSVNPDSQFLKLGVHFLRKSPSSKQLVWDLDTMANGEADQVATVLRLLLAHLKVCSDRLNKAMVLDGWGEEERATAFEAVGLFESGPTPQNGTTIATFRGT